MTSIRIYRSVVFTFKYLRIRLFDIALRPVQFVMRKRRMSNFMSHMDVDKNATILYLGGQPTIWSSVNPKLNITILNLPGIARRDDESHHNITYVEGDACNVTGYEDHSFDIFPIEAHCGMPFWWLYPESLRQYFISRWRRKLPAWTEMIEGTRVLGTNQLQALFPNATVTTERLLGVPKSYVACYVGSR